MAGRLKCGESLSSEFANVGNAAIARVTNGFRLRPQSGTSLSFVTAGMRVNVARADDVRFYDFLSKTDSDASAWACSARTTARSYALRLFLIYLFNATHSFD